MKVFCRFAPPPAEGRGGVTRRGSVEDALLLRVGGPSIEASMSTVTTASAFSATTGKRADIADPVTLSRASFSCDGVFLPPSAGTAQPAVAAAQQQQQLYEATCKHLLEPKSLTLEQEQRCLGDSAVPVAPRRIYLAYGQTASGKTYSLFGEISMRSGVEELSPSAGVVPRYLHSVFATRGSAAHHRCGDSNSNSASTRSTAPNVFVDISCFEVYNEVTSDLVALSVTQSMSNCLYPTGLAGLSGDSTDRRLNSKMSTEFAAGVTHLQGTTSSQLQLPVWVAHKRYRSEHQLDGAVVGATENMGALRNGFAMSEVSHPTIHGEAAATLLASSPTPLRYLKTEYKSTEKQQVLRSLEKTRCTTFGEAQAVLRALLALRQECATSRNQNSSRGHLVLCVQVYAPAAWDRSAGVWLMQHETSFVDLAGSESRKPTDATVADECHAPLVNRHLMTQGNPTADAARLSRASSQHSRMALDMSFRSGVSSHHSSISSGSLRNSMGTTTTSSAYHRSLLRTSLDADTKEVQARRLRETRCINASLLALRKVFRALYEATQSSCAAATRELATAAHPCRPPRHHAPFKDSALTAILEPFLVPQISTGSQSPPTSTSIFESSPQVYVVLLVCCSSRSADFFETVASLRLGAEATAVHPEIVLHALPAQQREQQRRQLYRCEADPQQSRCRVACRRQPKDIAATSCSRQSLFRSASAPSGRMALTSDEDELMERKSVAEGTGATRFNATLRHQNRYCVDKNLPHAKVTGMAHCSSEAVVSATDAALLSEEARRYKDTAQQLYRQCKSLCESYDECVAELQRCRIALSERDTRICDLEAALKKTIRSITVATQPSPHKPLHEPLQPCTPNGTTNGVVTRIPHSSGTQSNTQKKMAPNETPEGTPTITGDDRTRENAVPDSPTTMWVTTGRRHTGSISSTEGEGSRHLMVSVSPFSTASHAPVTDLRTVVLPESVVTLDDEGSNDGCISDDTREEHWSRSVRDRGNGKQHQGNSCGSVDKRQQQDAQNIIEAFLARRVLQRDARAEAASDAPPAVGGFSPSHPANAAGVQCYSDDVVLCDTPGETQGQQQLRKERPRRVRCGSASV